MAQKLWQGRSEGVVNPALDHFNSSLPFDRRLYREDIQGSIAHAKMLEAVGILTPGENADLYAALLDIRDDLTTGELTWDGGAEDVHMFIEAELTRRIGAIGKKLHTARSRNDQVATDLRLWARTHADNLTEDLRGLMRVLLDQAEQHTKSVMPGYTHLQRAQPVTAAFVLCAYAEMLTRDIERVGDARRRMNRHCPLGAGALAGTTHFIDREQTAALLGFDSPTPNAMDAVSDRDYCVEFLSVLSLIMVHLSRFCEELIFWSSSEAGFVRLADEFSTGSSMMPQKKNPDGAELIRGKSGRVFGHLTAMLTMLKGLPMAYNKDMQEDKEALFDGFDTVFACLGVLTPMIATMTFCTDRMRAAAAEGYLNATDLADYLVGKGTPFREAYAIAGALVREADGAPLESLDLDLFKAHSVRFEDDVYDVLDLDQCVARRQSHGGTAPDRVEEQIARLRTIVNG